MVKKTLIWDILDKTNSKNKSEILDTDLIVKKLLANRGLKKESDIKSYFNPNNPQRLTLKELDIKESQLNKAIARINTALKKKEDIIVFGDYDADGICATGILWELLYSNGLKVSPYIPDRLTEGYGLNTKTIERLKKENPKLKLIVTVDNGIVANDAVEKANELGIDVIITDHHQRNKKLPKAYAIVYTTKICGSGISWIVAREINKKIHKNKYDIVSSLDIAAIGTIADQMPLIGPNRSIVKFGLEILGKTKRPGLKALYETSSIKADEIGTYDVNYIIAPRLNAMGRLENATESLRLICTKSWSRAKELAGVLNKTNSKRQKIVDDSLMHAMDLMKTKSNKSVIVLAHESYHEGIIGLVAAKLVEEYYRPAIVLSKGKTFSKASARSIPGFNIIKAIRELDHLLDGAGGHEMAAGFSLATKNILKFSNEINKNASELLSENILAKKIKVDLKIDFKNIGWNLLDKLKDFEPYGIGNPTPVFVSKSVAVINARVIGSSGKHLKMKLEDEGFQFEAIYFNSAQIYQNLSPGKKVDIVFSIEENNWNGNKNLQLKIKDLK